MFFYMSGDQYQIADHCTDPSALNFALRFGSAAALERFLSDNAENVVSKNGKLQDKLVGVKFPGRKPFDIHIRFDLAVVLLTFTMFMVEPDHIVIRLVLTYWMEGNNSVKGKMVV